MNVYKTNCKVEKSPWYSLCVRNGAVYVYYGKNGLVFRGAVIKNNQSNNYFFKGAADGATAAGGELAAYAEELIPLQDEKLLLRKRDYLYII